LEFAVAGKVAGTMKSPPNLITTGLSLYLATANR